MLALTKQQKQEADLVHTGDHENHSQEFCAMRTSLNVLGGKWRMLIIGYLTQEPMRYGELRRAIPEISEKMLAQELKGLERDGLIRRVSYPEVPPRVEYHLTSYGKDAAPVVKAMLTWGLKYMHRPENPLTCA